MKIAIIGSTSYKDHMKNHELKLRKEGHAVKLPAFDSLNGNEYDICNYNRKSIEWADEVHVLWDSRSIGTVFDLGMCFAMHKPIKLIKINEKTFVNFVRLYAEEHKKE